jgi:predicted GTPase
MGPGKDEKFDELLQSLAKIAQKHSKSVIDSIMRWRQTQNNEKVNEDIVNLHSTHPWTAQADVYAILAERRTLACIYIMCRAFIQILKSVPKDALNDALGYRLEETTFEQFKRPDLKLLAQFANHRINDELYATLLGHLAKLRFDQSHGS